LGSVFRDRFVQSRPYRIPYTKDGISANTRAASFDDYEFRPLAERCLMSFTGRAGPALGNGMYNNTYQIVQSPNSVMMLTEMIHDVRVIPIVKPASEAKRGSSEIPKWGGGSVGWHEGDTPVVETVTSHPKQRSYITSKGKVTLRYTRCQMDKYSTNSRSKARHFSPGAGAARWLSIVRASRSTSMPVTGGNYALPGILAGARKLEHEDRPHPRQKAVFCRC